MTRSIYRSANSFLILTLIFCQQALGGSGGGKTAPEVRTVMAPAGAIESLGAIRVDGRIAQSGTILWGTELLQAPAVESAQIRLNEIGLISLRGGSTIKLASVLKAEGGAPILFAYLLAGAMTVKLNDRASARICVGDSIFALSAGAGARLLISEGHGRMLSSDGAVKEIADWRLFQAVHGAVAQTITNQNGPQMTPGEYRIEPYNFTFGLGGYADIEARSARYLQFRVTDKDDRPAPDLLLLILLKRNGDSSDAGTINYGGTVMRVTTDHNGVATARFEAGVTIGAITPIEVIIVKNNQTLKGNIRIVNPKGFWTLKKAGPVMGAVAAGTVAAIASMSRGPETQPRPPVTADEPVVIP
jgi:hypothetical protein